MYTPENPIYPSMSDGLPGWGARGSLHELVTCDIVYLKMYPIYIECIRNVTWSR